MEPADPSRPRQSPAPSLAEALRVFRLHGEADAVPSPAAVWLAATLATRLQAVVPPPFHVRAENGWVSYFNGPQWVGSTGVASILDQDLAGEPDEPGARDEPRQADQICSICWNVLNSVQDMISEATREPWPRLPQGGMADPGSRVEAGHIHLWYGPEGENQSCAVLSLAPIELVTPEMK